MVISPYFTQKNLEANRNDDQSNKLGDSPTRTGNFMVCVYTYIVNNIIDIMSRGIQKTTNLVMISMGHFYGPKNNKNNWAKDGDPGRPHLELWSEPGISQRKQKNGNK